MVWLIAFLIVLAILWYLIFNSSIFKRNNSSISNNNWHHLLKICLGNEKQAQRLLEHEKRINPKLTDDEACRMALMSYKRDNR